MRRGCALLLLGLVVACEGEVSCEEDIRAQQLDETVEVTIDAQVFEAELADETVERERGWKYRRCDRGALLLVPDEPGTPLPVWGCGLSEAIDAVSLANGQVIAIERVDPCPEPCGAACASHGEGLPVDAVLELPLDAAAGIEVGASASF